ncbi:MAG TPA: hypothetical protein VNZ45_12380 [Bacteroidia bacterium]|jgi:hypothetical protein|nr:hypothetical protein [Bacteroidia bacterium]
MQQIDSSSKRKQKLDYLKDILEDNRSIDDVMPQKKMLFILTSEPGIFYLSKGLDHLWEPVITNGIIKRYTQEDINALKRKPNCFCIELKSDNLKPFPIIESNTGS